MSGARGRGRAGGRREAPPTTRFVGVVARRGRFRVIEPLFERGGQVPMARGKLDPAVGSMVLAEPGSRGARALRELGSPRRARDVVDAILWEGLERRGFPSKLEAEAEAAAGDAAVIGGERRDLRELATFTVDPATARDFDDAVSAQPDGDGVRLWIHIADVSAHVRPGTGLETEALRRGTSVYVPGLVEPMLPRTLSDEACSLAPGVDRLAVTAEITLDGAGSVSRSSFYRSRIRSDARLDYDQLDEIFAGRRTAPEHVAEPLELARRASAALAAARPVGALEIESFEPEFEFDAEGDVTAARGVPQTEAHRLIEHLMIACNEQVAALLERRKLATLYRVHEQPDPERVAGLIAQLAALDVPTPPLPKQLSPREAGALVGRASSLVASEAARRGHGRDAWSALVLRSLKPAFYSHVNIGHAGLGSTAYAHFTSPIRRYPDLVAHRALLHAVGAGEEEPDAAAVRDAGWQSSEREREAVRLERRADRVCAAFLLERDLFEHGWDRSFPGEVSGLVGAGLFVRFAGELGDVYEGFLPARLLRGERFDLNETETGMVGRRTGRTVSLGDEIQIRVTGVKPARGRADLEPAY